MLAEINFWEFRRHHRNLVRWLRFHDGAGDRRYLASGLAEHSLRNFACGGNHFLDSALFGGSWGNWIHYLLDVVVLVAIALFAHRVTMARKMVTQYPWIYERAGLLSWREKASA